MNAEHLFMCHPQFLSSLSLCQPVYRVFTTSVRSILGYCTLFGVIVNEVDFLMSVSDSSSLVYRNATGVCILVLHLVTL